MALTQVPIELSSTPGIVDNSNATAITIDSSENVLVGTTDTAPGVTDTNEGFAINSSRVFVSRASDYSLSLNRTTDDGAIAIFRKDGSSVGSIGTSGGDIYLSNGTKSLLLTGSLVLPRGGTGGISDGTVDLGNGSNRFKDIYLSGGVNFSANVNASGMTSETLDDYEEGAWTPILRGDNATVSGQSYGAVTGHYVKVGQLVYAAFDFALTAAGTTNGGYAVIGNLPYDALSSNLGGGSMGYYTGLSNTTGPLVFYVAGNQAYLMEGSSTYVARSDITNTTRLIGFVSYRTSA